MALIVVPVVDLIPNADQLWHLPYWYNSNGAEDIGLPQRILRENLNNYYLNENTDPIENPQNNDKIISKYFPHLAIVHN